MSKVQRVVSIGAHSLDAELMGGPLLLKYAKQGAHCTCMHVTQGRLEDPNATKEECDAYLKELLDQNQRAAAKLGADTLWLGYVSSNMPTTEVFSDRLEKYFIDEKVDLVITHWRGSMHPQHINTHDAVVRAVKRMRENGSGIKLLYGETFEDLLNSVEFSLGNLAEKEKQSLAQFYQQKQINNEPIKHGQRKWALIWWEV